MTQRYDGKADLHRMLAAAEARDDLAAALSTVGFAVGPPIVRRYGWRDLTCPAGFDARLECRVTTDWDVDVRFGVHNTVAVITPPRPREAGGIPSHGWTVHINVETQTRISGGPPGRSMKLYQKLSAEMMRAGLSEEDMEFGSDPIGDDEGVVATWAGDFPSVAELAAALHTLRDTKTWYFPDTEDW